MVWHKPWTWYRYYKNKRKMIELEQISKESISRQSSGDSAFEKRCQEIAGQRYSTSEICGGPDPDYEQALREDRFAEDLRNMNY